MYQTNFKALQVVFGLSLRTFSHKFGNLHISVPLEFEIPLLDIEAKHSGKPNFQFSLNNPSNDEPLSSWKLSKVAMYQFVWIRYNYCTENQENNENSLSSMMKSKWNHEFIAKA